MFIPQETAKAAVLLFFKMRECKTKKTWKVNTFSSSGGELAALSNNEDKQEITWEGRENSPFLYITYILCFSFLLFGHVDGSRKKGESFHIKIKPKEYSVKMFLTFVLSMSREDVEASKLRWIHIKYFAEEFLRNSSHFKLSTILDFLSFFSIIDSIQQIESSIRDFSEKLHSVAARSQAILSLVLGQLSSASNSNYNFVRFSIWLEEFLCDSSRVAEKSSEPRWLFNLQMRILRRFGNVSAIYLQRAVLLEIEKCTDIQQAQTSQQKQQLCTVEISHKIAETLSSSNPSIKWHDICRLKIITLDGTIKSRNLIPHHSKTNNNTAYTYWLSTSKIIAALDSELFNIHNQDTIVVRPACCCCTIPASFFSLVFWMTEKPLFRSFIHRLLFSSTLTSCLYRSLDSRVWGDGEKWEITDWKI